MRLGHRSARRCRSRSGSRPARRSRPGQRGEHTSRRRARRSPATPGRRLRGCRGTARAAARRIRRSGPDEVSGVTVTAASVERAVRQDCDDHAEKERERRRLRRRTPRACGAHASSRRRRGRRGSRRRREARASGRARCRRARTRMRRGIRRRGRRCVVLRGRSSRRAPARRADVGHPPGRGRDGAAAAASSRSSHTAKRRQHARLVATTGDLGARPVRPTRRRSRGRSSGS